MIVVLAIMGLLAGLVAAGFRARSTEPAPADVARRIAGALREARARAIATDSMVDFEISQDRNGFRVAGSPAVTLPPGMAIQVTPTLPVETPRDGKDRIRFAADGSSSGGRITILDPRRGHADVMVNWFNGLATVRDAR